MHVYIILVIVKHVLCIYFYINNDIYEDCPPENIPYAKFLELKAILMSDGSLYWTLPLRGVTVSCIVVARTTKNHKTLRLFDFQCPAVNRSRISKLSVRLTLKTATIVNCSFSNAIFGLILVI